MLWYFPGGASPEMGPTSILPSSQIMGIDDDPDAVSQVGNFVRAQINPAEGCAESGTHRISPHLREHRLTSEPGQPAAFIVHTDIIHRGLPRTVPPVDAFPFRPLLKLQFFRTQEPVESEAPDVDWEAAGDGYGVGERLGDVWRTTWRWLHGCPDAPHETEEDVRVDELVRRLRQAPRVGGEAERLAAAYALGRAAQAGDAAASAALGAALGDTAAESLRRAARGGLLAAGSAAWPIAAPLCRHDNGSVARAAIEVLGECSTAAARAPCPGAPTWEQVLRLLGEVAAQRQEQAGRALQCGSGSDWDVVAGCAKAAWLVAGASRLAPDGARCRAALLPLLALCLGSRGPDGNPEVEAPAHRVQTSARAARRNASLALVSLASCGGAGAAAERELVALLQAAAGDDDRYVRSLGMEALHRLSNAEAGVAGARSKALGQLLRARWCPLTDAASPF